jgi:hypothetical protein
MRNITTNVIEPTGNLMGTRCDGRVRISSLSLDASEPFERFSDTVGGDGAEKNPYVRNVRVPEQLILGDSATHSGQDEPPLLQNEAAKVGHPLEACWPFLRLGSRTTRSKL